MLDIWPGQVNVASSPEAGMPETRPGASGTVERRSWEFDWSALGAAYDFAHDLALVRANVPVG